MPTSRGPIPEAPAVNRRVSPGHPAAWRRGRRDQDQALRRPSHV